MEPPFHVWPEESEEYKHHIAQGSRYRRAIEQLDDMTIDRVAVGDEESESIHRMEAVHSHSGRKFDRAWRDARAGGDLMYETRIKTEKHQMLYFVFMSNEKGRRTFDVQIDGKTIDTVDLEAISSKVQSPLFHYLIPIPSNLTWGKNKVSVKLQAKRGHTVGGIWEIRVLDVDTKEKVPDVFKLL